MICDCLLYLVVLRTMHWHLMLVTLALRKEKCEPMDKIEEELRFKYGRGLVPREEIQSKLNELVGQGYICAEDIKYVVGMTVDDFVQYISGLRRNFLYADYEFKDFDSFKEPFSSFIEDLREKTQIILSESEGKPEAKLSDAKKTFVNDVNMLKSKKADILMSVLQTYLQYERKRSSVKWGYFAVVGAVVAFCFASYTNKPF